MGGGGGPEGGVEGSMAGVVGCAAAAKKPTPMRGGVSNRRGGLTGLQTDGKHASPSYE